jgi:hypothetical protein
VLCWVECLVGVGVRFLILEKPPDRSTIQASNGSIVYLADCGEVRRPEVLGVTPIQEERL